ncbi:Methyl-directed repair DNA adenine methylase [Methylophaga frappieri]|uniref:Site-specific DNA-methyltransferase (adenine-specific) n=1 Tax=Methylophaga frappieri (strain ATCC BAA-2434 / DSM 25690 / JAM7) TaxID=754477 RepID=I1YEF4_METFJ|nr:Dam family site-specific DNA-(adenine-N6)-methyltransferase [Methylophaga frappieri]AFJ01297.1 Methyl-directed repair DNA adenine methylase [Methylophaga frappieri]
MTDAGLRPPLKWAGGKRWLLPELQKRWKPHASRRLVEPFCGGLAVALGLQPKQALLNDINPALINFYQQLQRGLTMTIAMANDESLYYQHRQSFNNQSLTDADRAQLFYYLNRTGYNGLCRFNKSGAYNVPFGRYKTIYYQTDFSAYSPVLSDWQFTQLDFEALTTRPTDFIYADPPYDVPFRQYAQQGFDWQDQERLALWLSKHPGPVVLSNQATDRICRLYRQLGFRLRYLQAPRRISCKTASRKTVKEVLAVRGF